jgi:hypothetical protein
MPTPTLAQLYLKARCTPSAINEHIPLLFDLACRCRHITEFGTEKGISTTAFLYAGPETLVCYDKAPKADEIIMLEVLTAGNGTTFLYIEADDRAISIAPTDMLFIDTDHTYAQLKEELRLHSDQVKRWIVLHDTEAFPGMYRAVEEFLGEGKWKIERQLKNNNGLTVLCRT